MKNKEETDRNWALIVIASIVILIDLALLIITCIYFSKFGWWALATIAGALSSLCMAIVAIKKNDPSWLLLDLLLS